MMMTQWKFNNKCVMSGYNMSYLLDTNFIIGLQQRNPQALSVILDNNVLLQNCFMSVISELEVLGFPGNTDQDIIQIKQLIAPVTCIELTKPIQQQTIKLRRQHKIKLPDAIILATAQVFDLQILTFDKKLLKYSQQS